MPNFVKISLKMKKLSIQARHSDRSVCMAAICYSGAMSAIPTNKQLLGEKRMSAKLQVDNLKTEALVCVYTGIYIYIYIYGHG